MTPTQAAPHAQLAPHARLHTTTFGEETAAPERRVAFLHGLMGRGRNFSGIAAALAPQFTSLLVDLPNHGNSPWTDSFDYLAMADTVAAELRRDFAQHGAVNVVGHSMGGKVAMLLALRHPELVRKLVVVDISPSNASHSNFDHLLGSLLRLDLDSFDRRVDAHEALRAQIPDDTVRGFLLQNLVRTDDGFAWQPHLSMLFAELDSVMGFPLVSTCYEAPVLWVKGEHSPYISDEDQPAMRALFPRVRRITVRGAGHWVHADQPEATSQILREFFA